MKTIGIIGGFGPEATAQFYLKLVDAYRKAHHGTQPHIILRNVSVPSKLEHDALVLGKNLDKFAPLLTGAAKKLEACGADFIVLPCNTLHIHEDTIKASVTLPFVSLITATIQFLTRHHISRVGFLGSRVTIQENLFKKRSKGIQFVTVNTDFQRKIDAGLDEFVIHQNSTLLRKALHKACSTLDKQKVNDVLLACTDFGSLCPTVDSAKFHDTVDILVEATVNML